MKSFTRSLLCLLVAFSTLAPLSACNGGDDDKTTYKIEDYFYIESVDRETLAEMTGEQLMTYNTAPEIFAKSKIKITKITCGLYYDPDHYSDAALDLFPNSWTIDWVNTETWGSTTFNKSNVSSFYGYIDSTTCDEFPLILEKDEELTIFNLPNSITSYGVWDLKIEFKPVN